VFFCVVNVANVVVVDLAATIFVELCVGALNKSNSIWVHGTFDDSQKFVVINGSVSVLVESSEEGLYIYVSKLKTRFLTSLSKLLQVKSARPIIVHYFEDSTDSNY